MKPRQDRKPPIVQKWLDGRIGTLAAAGIAATSDDPRERVWGHYMLREYYRPATSSDLFKKISAS